MYENFDLETFKPDYDEILNEVKNFTTDNSLYATKALSRLMQMDIADKIYAEFQGVVANAKNLNDSKATKMLREIQTVLVEHHNDRGRKKYAKRLNQIIDIFIDNEVFAGINPDAGPGIDTK